LIAPGNSLASRTFLPTIETGDQPMDTFDTSDNIDRDRRGFFGTAAATFAAAQLGLIGSVNAQTKSKELPAIKPGANTSFGPLKQIDAGVLNVGYAEAGPANGPVPARLAL
jgi:hypothetical protein